MSPTARKKRVIFVCTANSCRSQMAEGFARHLGGGLIEAASAGLEPHGLNPRAVAVMAEAGVNISAQTSDPLRDDDLNAADIVVTLCGDAAERCPLTPPHVLRLHWPLPDPARATGSEEEVRAVFRAVRDQVKARVEDLIARIHAGTL